MIYVIFKMVGWLSALVLLLVVPAVRSVDVTSGDVTACPVQSNTKCHSYSYHYCPPLYDYGSTNPLYPTCEKQECRCLDMPYHDLCTCSSHFAGCIIQYGTDAASAVGLPTLDGVPQTISSCIVSDCDYQNLENEVHVIRNYNSPPGLNRTTHVQVDVVGENTRNLILVFTSYWPVDWNLTVSNETVIDTVIVEGQFIGSTLMCSPGQVSSKEVILLPYSGYARDSSYFHQAGVLVYLTERFGPISSYSSSYWADRWTMTIDRSSGSSMCVPPMEPPDPVCANNSGSVCYEGGDCSPDTLSVLGRNYTPSCVDGYCRCRGIPYTDYCTCLPHVSSCLIERDAASPVVIPSTDGSPELTYSCIGSNNSNPDFEVHVISVYKSSRNDTTIRLELALLSVRRRNLVLVLTSHDYVRWNIISKSAGHLDSDRDKIFIYYGGHLTYDRSWAYNPFTTEEFHYNLNYGYGLDTGGGHTTDNLHYLTKRFGPISSFSGTYQADRWIVTIEDSSSARCGHVESPRNGDVVYRRWNQHPTAIYTCDEGYRLFGDVNRTCQNGTWSGLTPVCTRFFQCTYFGVPSAHEEYYEAANGSVIATYSCYDGYTMTGNSSRWCYNDTWSADPPVCTKSSGRFSKYYNSNVVLMLILGIMLMVLFN